MYYSMPEREALVQQLQDAAAGLNLIITLPPRHTNQMTPETKVFVLDSIREWAVRVGVMSRATGHNFEMKMIHTHISSFKDKEMFGSMKKVVKNPKWWCACGQMVSQKKGILVNHFKTAKHCQGVYQHVNGYILESVYQETGLCPPGFTRLGDPIAPKWSHIIPDDPKRLDSHPIRRDTGDFDLGKGLMMVRGGNCGRPPARPGQLFTA